MKINYHFITITLLFVLIAYVVLTRKEQFVDNNSTPKLTVFPGNKEVVTIIQFDTQPHFNDYIILQYYIPYQDKGKVTSKIIPIKRDETMYTIPIKGLKNNTLYQFQCWLVRVDPNYDYARMSGKNKKYIKYASNIVSEQPKETLRTYF